MNKWGHSAFSALSKKQNVPNTERGFILVAVIIAITLVAAIAFALSQQGASETNVTSGELERDQLRYVAEAGMAHAKLQLAKNTSCSGYTDIPKTDFGADSYKAKFRTDEGSPVTIKAKGYLPSGAEIKLQSNPVRAYQPSTAVVLQLGTTAGKDTMINRWFDIQNYGAVDNLTVRSDPSRTQRALLEFDLSAIPASTEIIFATLELEQRAISTAGVINVHRVTRSWLEGTGTGTGGADGATWLSHDGSTSWSQPGGDFDSTQYAATTTTISKNGQWVAWDIRDLVDEWVSGQLPNDGLLLAGDGVVDSVEFHSSEGLNPASAPKLTITYACECGKTCGGAAPGKNVLLVVGDPANLTTEQADKKALMEGWGHTVTLVATSTSQAEIEAAAATADVVYVPELGGGPMAELDTKADDLATAVITEEARTALLLGSWSLFPFVDADAINITGNTHYITETLPIGNVQLSTSTQSMWVLKGTLAPDLHVLGELNGTQPGLAYLESGTRRNDGSLAPARRVKLPWGSFNFDPNDLTGQGLTIMQRAIEWGAAPPPVDYYLDEFNSLTCDPAADYAGSDGSRDWSPWAWTEINELDGPCSGQIRVATDPDIDDAGSSRLRVVSQGVRVYRTVDLTGFSQPTLSFDYRLIDYPALDFMRIRVFDGVVYTEIDRFTGPFDQTAYQSASYSLSAFAGLEIQVQFEFNGTGTTRTSYIDNVHIREAGPGGGGEVTFEEFTDASLDSDGLNITIPKPAGTAAGDLLIATIVTDGENKPEMTAPAGWTLIDHGRTSKQVTMDVLWKIADASESGSYDFSWAKSQQAYGWIMRFTGHDPAAPIHDAQSDGGTSSSPVSPAVTTTIANTMIVRIGGFDDDDISPGDPGLSGHTAITMGASSSGSGTASGGAGYVLQSGTGDSGESSFSLTASEEYRAVTIAIAPAP